MKIVMFSPGLRDSAIGRVTFNTSTALQRLGHALTVIRSEAPSFLRDDPHDFDCDLIAWKDIERVQASLAAADAVIYHVGDNYAYHCGCLDWMRAVPGIVCLHDFYVANLFFEWAGARRCEADAVVSRWYGSPAVQMFFEAATGGDFIERTRDAFPMTEWICAMATAVITHSHWGLERVRRACPGPVAVAPLPFESDPEDLQRVARAPRSARLGLVTVGHVNANKRAASVIRAIGTSELLRASVVYRIVGAIEPGMALELSRLARDLGVRLRITGEVGHEGLINALGQADIACCLRWPALEAASASTIEAMLFGKAVVVTDTGFYADLPDDCVAKVDPADEVASLRRILEGLASDPAMRIEMARRGQTWAAQTFTADHYARQLIALAEDAARAWPMAGAMAYFRDLVEYWGGRSAGWTDVEEPLGPLRAAVRPPIVATPASPAA